MSLVEKLERLARLVPGVAGYQDKETSRDTDKSIRLRLASALEEIKRELEEDKRQLMKRKELSLLPTLDRLASKLDKLGNTVKYASRGYRGVFDTYKLGQQKLEQLYAFDLGLLERVESLKTQAEEIRGAHGDAAALEKVSENLGRSLDQFEKVFATRQDMLMTR